MKRARLLAAILAVFVLAACNDGALPPGGTYQAVSGTVVDAVTNQPVSGATVTVLTVLNATTDAQGKFTFAQVPVGDVDYQVTVANGGYKPYTGTVHLAPDKPASITIALSKSS